TFRDDRFVPATFSVGVQTWFTPFGYKPEYEHADASDGSRSMGYMFRHAVDDMERDFGVFRPSTRHVDADLSSTRRHAADVADVIGDVLPVVTDFPSITFGPSHALIQMMSMETLFTSMVDHPELFHRMMRALTDDFLSYLDALDASGVVTPGGDTGHVSQDTCGYCTELPGAAGPGGPRGVAGIWGYSLAQESVGLSPAMFDEFLFSYTKEVTDRFGLVSFGCCEPLDAFWEGSLSRMGNLRKLSVSPWCAEERMGEMLRGRKVVYHRKPFPVLMTTPTFDEGAFRAHMERTVRAARGCPLEVTFRDITSCAGDPARLVRAVEITREAFADCYR
ncbi:MAG: hypothetical protein FWE70_03765, partial [Oscillospiraceae bacterium]|nr:hypothetical protein [Oscillospiraceae bacterium]